MAAITSERWNDLFVSLNRSLLQYVGECWPWTGDATNTSEASEIRSVLAEQRQDVELLGSYLQEAGWVVNYGGYPSAFTDLHYVSLSYLVKQIVRSQSDIVSKLEAALRDDPDNAILQRVISREKQILTQVQSLATGTKLAPATITS